MQKIQERSGGGALSPGPRLSSALGPHQRLINAASHPEKETLDHRHRHCLHFKSAHFLENVLRNNATKQRGADDMDDNGLLIE